VRFKMIPYGRQDISQEDIDAVVKVLQSDFLTQGPMVPKFEQAVAQYCGAQYGVAVNSATSALHIACLALDLGPGDTLWTSPNTFVASSNCALYCGAKVDFVDIDPLSYNMSVEHLEQKLLQAKQTNTLPKIVVPVHFAGQSCDMKAIFALSKEYGFNIIEDASHAIGGKYLNEPVGNCRYSDITVFSFHPVKIITTAEGGMAMTNNTTLASNLQRYRSHGISSNPADMSPRPTDEIWNYQQIKLGLNYRMTDIQAALGLSQMNRLDTFVANRHEIASRYNEAFANTPIKTPWQLPDTYSAYHLYPLYLELSQINKTQREVYDKLGGVGIAVNLHYIPVYRQPYYEAMGFKIYYCSNAEKYFKSVLSIPMYSAFTEANQQFVIFSLKKVINS
jgi:UDP-4-amino-4,6-dideoxy-N-acetyl-beta-L-altrosamine transaminase